MNYRKIKKENYRKTNIVMFIYIVLFLLIGLLGETIYISLTIPPEYNLIDAMVFTYKAILSGVHVPIFTISMSVISLVVIFITIKFGNKIMLSGNQYIKLNDKEHMSKVERMVLNTVEELKISSRLRFMPDVYIIDEPYMNAFASGWSEGNSMVAITKGLLDKLTRAEVEAVMAHEMGHIKNADVRLTLIVGVLTNVMVYAVDWIYYTMIGRGSNNKAMQQAKIVIFVLKIFLPILTIVLQLYISRKREFLADAASVEFTGNQDAMVSALQKISSDYKENDYDLDETENQTRKFANFFDAGSWFSTHPKVEHRIKNLMGEKI
ncbi:MAG: zinc metalloprotease HtpX [Campylobacteraceae bacterium 4484_166]|nr:MAG: zinc metalloprotease HtpX [Campylobacteraceae bacterium 4484_166]